MRSLTQKLLDRMDRYIHYPSHYFEQIFSKRFSYRVLNGIECHSGIPIKILYFGEGYSLEYVKTLFFRADSHESLLGQYSLFEAIRGTGVTAQDYDLSICEFTPRVSRIIPRKGRFKIPEWIEQEVSLTGSWDDVVGRFRKNTRSSDLRLVRKYNYTWDVVIDPESVKYFYYNLYLPYVNQRFQKAVQIVDDNWLIAVAERGGLLRILSKDQVIAGAVLYPAKKFLDWIWVGALAEDNKDINKGAFSSLYYHSIKYAHDKGYPRIKLGGSRPFLTDGVYRYKRKWGAQIVKGRYNDTALMVDFNFQSQGCQQWLEASPFFTEHHKGIDANIFSFTELAKGEQLLKRIENLVSPGIHGIKVYSFNRLAGLPDRIGSCQVHNIGLNGEPGSEFN